jgi:N,N'-diacetyllegionaminate synthase
MQNLHDMLIDGRPIGPGQPCFIVAEIGQAHDGSLGAAHAYIDAVAQTGADAIKFQTHIAAAESTPGEPFRVKFSRQDATRYDYWRRMEFTEPQWQGLADHAAECGLTFLSTPFSFAAVDLLQRVGAPAWKVGSGEVNNLPMLEYMAQTGKPVLLSSGMSPWADLDAAVACVRRENAPVAVFQCTTSYPCPPESLGLNVLAELRERYACPVGLSDHSGDIYAGLAAATLGANMLEVHVVFSHDCFGPDTPASVTIASLKQLVDGIRFIECALAHPVDKEAKATELTELRQLFGKSVVTAAPLPAGHELTRADLDLKKPGDGIPASQLSEVIGRKLKRAVAENTILAEADLA